MSNSRRIEVSARADAFANTMLSLWLRWALPVTLVSQPRAHQWSWSLWHLHGLSSCCSCCHCLLRRARYCCSFTRTHWIRHDHTINADDHADDDLAYLHVKMWAHDDDDEQIVIGRSQSRLAGWTRSHQSSRVIQFMVWCHVVDDDDDEVGFCARDRHPSSGCHV